VTLVKGDEELAKAVLKAHHEAVKDGVKFVESELVQTRIMEKGVIRIERTGNAQFALWQHDASRNLDPQLHTHAIMMNHTQDRTGKWRTIDNSEIYRNSMLIGAVYHNSLANRLHALGYQTEWNKDGTFEVTGYSREQIEAFSTRRAEIVAGVGAEASDAERDIEAKRTRKAKVKRVDRTELHRYWGKLATENGLVHPVPNLDNAREIPNRSDVIGGAKEVLGDKKVAFSERDLLKESLRQSQGSYKLEGIEQEIYREKAEGQILTTADGRLTTEKAVAREERIIGAVNAGKGTQTAIGTSKEVQAIALEKTFNAGQVRGLELIATTQDRIIIIQGDAGVGKSYTLAGLRELTETKAIRLRGLAPSAASAEILEHESGIPSQTLDSYLIADADKLPRGEVLILDEAGQASARHLDDLFKKAEATGSRVILVGDGKQLSGVQAGSPFKLLQSKSEISVALIDETMRQKDPFLKEVVGLIAKGQIEESYSLLQGNGKVLQIKDQEERITAFANDYLGRSPEVQDQTLMLAGTNTERKLINAEVRKELMAVGRLGPEARTIEVLRAKELDSWEKKQVVYYEAGDIVQFNRDYSEFKKGESYTVTGMDRRLGMLTLVDSQEVEHQSPVKKNLERQVYKKENLDLAVGDKGKFTKNDRSLNVLNGQEFIVKELREDGSFLVTTKGRDKVYSAKELFHSDHNYVSTVYGSQGKTAKYVLYDADSYRALSIGKEAYYVAVSRGKEEVVIYASNPQALGIQIKESRANENALELLEPQAQAVLVGATVEAQTTTEEQSNDQQQKRTERPSGGRTIRLSRDFGRKLAERLYGSVEADAGRNPSPPPESGKPDLGKQPEDNSRKVNGDGASIWESEHLSKDFGERFAKLATERFGTGNAAAPDKPTKPPEESREPDLRSQPESDSGRIDEPEESIWESDYGREILRASGHYVEEAGGSKDKPGIPEREQQSESVRAHAERDEASLLAASGDGRSLGEREDRNTEFGDGAVERIAGSPGNVREDNRVEISDGIGAGNSSEVGGTPGAIGGNREDAGTAIGSSRSQSEQNDQQRGIEATDRGIQGDQEAFRGLSQGTDGPETADRGHGGQQEIIGGPDQETSRDGKAKLGGEKGNTGVGERPQDLANQQRLKATDRAVVAGPDGRNTGRDAAENAQLQRRSNEGDQSLDSGITGGQPAPDGMARLDNDANTQGRIGRTENQRQEVDFKQLAAELREQPLEKVAEYLGLERDSKDKKKWRGNGQTFSINGEKFYDHINEKGAGGAIDLVMASEGIKYQEAVNWLKERFITSEGVIERPATRRTEEAHIIPKPKQPFVEPIRDDSKWPAVRDYLINERKLNHHIVDAMHEIGILYADGKQNAVFLRHECKYEDGNFVRGKSTGANIRGTYPGSDYKGLAEGTVREDGWHWIGMGDGPIKKIVLAEAPIDGLSCAMLDDNRKGRTIYLSADGSGPIPVEQIRQAMDQGARVVIAYDSPEIGSEHSQKAARKASDKVIDKLLTPQVVKVIEEGSAVVVVQKGSGGGQTLLSTAIPPQHKDWNEALKASEVREAAQREKRTKDRDWQR
jgi:ATP-dependent exoDNAse (exonuclease V) alpha subunit